LDGLATSLKIKDELAEQLASLSSKGKSVGLGTIMVGDDPASSIYVAGKHQDCAEVGIKSLKIELPSGATEEELLEAVRTFNNDRNVTGFLVQFPLPEHIDQNKVLENIEPAKDADGLHPVNLGRLVNRTEGPFDFPTPCTPQGIVELVERHGISWGGKNVVIVGRGLTVGRPLGLLLSRKGIDATVTLAHSKSSNLCQLARGADVIVAAAGIPEVIGEEMVKPGAVVIDVGVTRRESNGRILGDVSAKVWAVAGHVSPNPGGVGPMTRALLLRNVYEIGRREVAKLG
jgi:methylenetetrahydrofolate dehydrogenase (NADP+)/methenyltetrahydrofolate cyclohydrolase